MTAQERSRHRVCRMTMVYAIQLTDVCVQIARLREGRLDLQKACADAFTALRQAKYGLANAEQDIKIVSALRSHRLAHLNKYKESAY